MNDSEIKYNCKSLVSTWFERNKDTIKDTSKISLVTDNDVINGNLDNLSDGLFNLIKRYSKTNKEVKFCYNDKVLEIFSIN